MTIRKLVSLSAVFAVFAGLGSAAAAADCRSIAPPAHWSGPEPARAPSSSANLINPLFLVMVRHGEKPLDADGFMIETGNLSAIGLRRATRLPERLLGLFGCPDLIVAPDPAVKIRNPRDGLWFNYERASATVEPLAARLSFPLWMPYGYPQVDQLSVDLLRDRAFAPAADGRPRQVQIGWEHSAIVALTERLRSDGPLTLLPLGRTVRHNGRTLACQAPPVWLGCDFDSIWVLAIAADGTACFSHQRQKLNTPAFQRQCRGDERP
jgi:hypothetical protein